MASPDRTEPLPKIKVTNSQNKDGGRLRGLSPGTPSPTAEEEMQWKQDENAEVRPIAAIPSAKALPNKLRRSASIGENGVSTSSAEEKAVTRDSAIDPLSHLILKRTRTENMIPQKLRTGETSTFETGSSGAVADAAVTGRKPSEQSRGDSLGALREKKKGVSFLSRFIGSKKKDPSEDVDDESELGDRRTEGMDAHVFSQPIGYTPQFPPPPKYIKVRSHNKREREFNRVFLAQELFRKRADREGGLSPNPSASKGAGDAIWTIEFSRDGKYLAAGGQDTIVRVWTVISTQEERDAFEKEEFNSVDSSGHGVRLNAPVFRGKTIRDYQGHTGDVLDLSWSKNNFLLSSSMDKTVRLWHISRPECLCCFKHNDFVTSISFHPRDDRFFLAGSLDSKLRLWSIPDKSVAFWSQLPDLITAVAFTPDGKIAIAGCLTGLCLFYETEGLKYHSQVHVRSSHGRNAKGSKITGLQAINYPPNDLNGDVKFLVTSNDSRVRLYSLKDKSLEMKFKQHENTCSQIHANFSDDAKYVICGSEDRKAYIWNTGPAEGEKKDKRPVEFFEAHSAIVTSALLAPTKTRQLLGSSGDPLYDLCNPPPVTLVSRADSRASSKPRTDRGSEPGGLPTPGISGSADSRPPAKPEESPAYLVRGSHNDGNIIVTADYTGRIKVFRQDCAYHKRRVDSWDASSTFSKKIGTGILGRSGSTATRTSGRSRRNSSSTQLPADRILSWRNSIGSNASLDGGSMRHRNRSISPRKSAGQGSYSSAPARQQPGWSNSTTNQTSSTYTESPFTSLRKTSTHELPNVKRSEPASRAVIAHFDRHQESDPLMVQAGGQSLAFWNTMTWKAQSPLGKSDPEKLGPPPSKKSVSGSLLSSEEGSNPGGFATSGESDSEALKCRKCGSFSFRAKTSKGPMGQRLVCTKCGTLA